MTTTVNINIPSLNERLLGHRFVPETTARRASSNWTYAGTVRTVGAGGTYATISAAISAAVSGDVIQVIDGVYDINAESGGYLIINSTTKSLLIRGNTLDNTAVVLRQTAAAAFCLRFRASNNVTFESLTIETNQAVPTITGSMDTPASPVTFKMSNCIIRNTSTANVNTINFIGTPVNNCFFEFDKCDISKSSNISALCIGQADISDANAALYDLPILVTNSNIYGHVSFLGASKLYFYDNYFLNSANTITFSVGQDTATPTIFESLTDLRNNQFEYATGFTNHAILIGRGANNAKVINNTVIMGSTTNTLSLGIVVKSICNTLGDMVVEGNYIISPRPLYLKGASMCIVRNNTTFSNWGDGTLGAGFELNNPSYSGTDIQSNFNEVYNNVFKGKASALRFSSDFSVTGLDSAKTCKFYGNIYSVPSGAPYILVPNTPWENRRSVFKNDANSIFFEI